MSKKKMNDSIEKIKVELANIKEAVTIQRMVRYP